jgi:nucleoside-diphosphate-sugar epimerase
MSSTQPTNLHVVIGAGATGTATAALLASTGAQVKIVTRSGSGPTADGIELVAVDASDAAQLTTIASGARAIYNCANPPYNRWTTDWPPLAASLLTTAEATGAVLVTLSNLYGYAPPTRPMLASEPLDPSAIKGGVRAQMWQDALAAHSQGRVRVTEARASDFIGPDVGANGHMGDRVIPRILKGKSVSLLGNVDVDHSWTAIDDVARTLVTLGEDERAWGRAWHVPTTAPLSQRELVHRVCSLADVEPVKVSTVPSFVLRTVGVFVAAIRELREVAYQFEAPFVIDSQETIDTFALTPTALDDTLRATLASYGHNSGSNLHVHS